MKLDREESREVHQERAQRVGSPFPVNEGSRSTDIDRVLDRPFADAGCASSRREFRWSKAARELVRSNSHAKGREVSALVTRLAQETGNPRWACRRFARSMGLQCKRPHRSWTAAEQKRLLKLLDLYPLKEIAKLLRRSQSSIWHMLYRLGANVKMRKDSFTKYTLAVALHVRPETIENWINLGWLKAQEMETGASKRVVIDAEDFCEFCKQHTKDVVGNRLTKERLEFVYQFAFPPSHAELLPVRDSKKERKAFEQQTLGAAGGKKPVVVDDMEDEDDDLELIA